MDKTLADNMQPDDIVTTMNREELIKVFCEITSNVWHKRFNNDITCDCFCGYSPYAPSHPIVNAHIINFIREAVGEKLEKHNNK